MVEISEFDYKLDLENLKSLAKSVFSDYFSKDYEHMANDFNYRIFVAKKSQQFCGFLILLMVDEKAEVIKVATDEKFRRMGVASELMKKGIDFSKDGGKVGVILEVNEHNTPAKTLYEKLGFKQIHVRKRYYNGTDDAIIELLEF